MNKRTLFLCAAAALLSINAQAQSPKKLLKKARKALSEANYNLAKQRYNQLITLQSDQSVYHFEAGLSYYNSGVEREKSVGYFENALKYSTKDTIAEIFYYLGKAYHYTHQFDKAIYHYNEFREKLRRTNQGQHYATEVNRLIEMCNHGKEFQAAEDPEAKVKNLGAPVNTEYSEYVPVFTKDESQLIFTARKKNSTGGKRYNDNRYYEDIYISVKSGQNWLAPVKIDSTDAYVAKKHSFNTKGHDAVIGINEAGDKLFIYRNSEVWQSDLKNGKWSEPVRMNKNINSKGVQPSVFLTPDEKTLLLVSDRKGGQGGRDIYISTKDSDGTWGAPTNLGPTINTSLDEDAPFLSADGKFLYFSSKGHNSMGGYDVFRSEKDANGNWGKPVNLGMPVNSAGDDIYYLQHGDNKVGYYASSRMNGSGEMDIYRVEFGCANIPQTEIRGLVLGGEKQLPVMARITVKDKETGQEVGQYTSDRHTGKYVMVLPPEKTYVMELVAEGFDAQRPHREEFTLPKQCQNYQLFQQVNLRRYKDSTARDVQEALFQNAPFDIAPLANEAFGISGTPTHTGTGLRSGYEWALGGKVMHNNILPAKRSRVFLVNEQNEIVAATTTNADGVFSFNGVQNRTYSVMISEEDARISYYGDARENRTEVPVLGDVYLTSLESRESQPLQIPVMLADKNKKVTYYTESDAKGHFVFKPEQPSPRIAELNASSFPYKIDFSDPYPVFSSYIQTIDPNNNELSYSEFVDRIYLEQVIRQLPGMENIYFDFDRFALRNQSEKVLDQIATFLQENPDVVIEIAGHCDSKGSDEYNMKLSENRSQSAYNYLLKKGIPAGRMKKTWFGESKPSAPNTNPDGSDNPENRQLNRRVEFRVQVAEMAELTLRL